MKIKIISWNVRGVNDPEKRKVIKNFLRSYRADIVCLQETKVQEMSVELARGLGVGRRLNWKVLNAEGSAGAYFCFGTTVVSVLWIPLLEVSLLRACLECLKMGFDGPSVGYTV